jgi:hypothetical protein
VIDSRDDVRAPQFNSERLKYLAGDILRMSFGKEDGDKSYRDLGEEENGEP